MSICTMPCYDRLPKFCQVKCCEPAPIHRVNPMPQPQAPNVTTPTLRSDRVSLSLPKSQAPSSPSIETMDLDMSDGVPKVQSFSIAKEKFPQIVTNAQPRFDFTLMQSPRETDVTFRGPVLNRRRVDMLAEKVGPMSPRSSHATVIHIRGPSIIPTPSHKAQGSTELMSFRSILQEGPEPKSKDKDHE
jgi:hypothetical protein